MTKYETNGHLNPIILMLCDGGLNRLGKINNESGLQHSAVTISGTEYETRKDRPPDFIY